MTKIKFLFVGGHKLSLIPSYLYDKFLAVFYRGAMKYCGKMYIFARQVLTSKVFGT